MDGDSGEGPAGHPSTGSMDLPLSESEAGEKFPVIAKDAWRKKKRNAQKRYDTAASANECPMAWPCSKRGYPDVSESRLCESRPDSR